ncbi:MAG: radical SAM protein, partial [bacterium]
MIPPKEQWCIQVDITNACTRACSNCTRMLSHVTQPFFMACGEFVRAVDALKDFPEESLPSKAASIKLVGVIGGEPLLHPAFPTLLRILADKIPNKNYRGLWTGLKWESTEHADIIREVFDEKYIHNNRHEKRAKHTPVLIAIREVVEDPAERARIIDGCWLQHRWSSSITPKGLFFCEVAGAMDMVFGGPGGLSVEPGCWRRPLEDFREQIDRWCQRCGV